MQGESHAGLTTKTKSVTVTHMEPRWSDVHALVPPSAVPFNLGDLHTTSMWQRIPPAKVKSSCARKIDLAIAATADQRHEPPLPIFLFAMKITYIFTLKFIPFCKNHT